VVNCRVLELGCGVGVYVDALKTTKAKRGRVVVGGEPNAMGGVFGRPGGPIQHTQNILEVGDPTAHAAEVRSSYLGSADYHFDLLYSIEVMGHIPLDRQADAFKLLAGLAREGTKLIFGAAHLSQRGTGHIGCRPKQAWEKMLAEVGFVKHREETKNATVLLQDYNHKVNTQVYYFTRQS
jgi:hypothetical protein